MKFLLGLLTVISVLMASGGETEVWYDGNGLKWYYSVDAGSVVIGIGLSGVPAIPISTAGKVEIPSVIAGCPVVRIGPHAFSGCTGLTSVDIPFGVDEIGQSAFSQCESLSSVFIPASVKRIGNYAFYGCKALTSVMIPSGVLAIGSYAFYECSGLGSVRIPRSVTNVCSCAFYGCTKLCTVEIPSSDTVLDCSAFGNCSSLQSVTIPACVTKLSSWFNKSYTTIQNVVLAEGTIGVSPSAFSGAIGLQTIEIPASVTSIGGAAFSGCGGLMSVIMHGDAPDLGSRVFDGTPKRLVVTVPNGSIGWNGGISEELPETWGGRAIVHSGETYDWRAQSEMIRSVSMTITNIVVSYVLNSVKPEFAIPLSCNNGFVNVVAEVKGGFASIPETWANEYPDFVSMYGADFQKALSKKSGKVDAFGREMFVWQDYIAGTDPTKIDDKFTASIVIVDGKVQISHSPELDSSRAAIRKYTIFGKSCLTDQEWCEVIDGAAEQYNFFKVTVEMKP